MRHAITKVGQYAIPAAVLFLSSPALAGSYAFGYEAVNNYGGNNLPNSLADASGFYMGLYNGQWWGWSPGIGWYDGSVWDIDFADPGLPGNPNADDSSAIDQPGYAITFFAGHGVSDDGFPTSGQRQICVNSGQCPSSNNPFGTGNGVCRHIPGQTDVQGHKFGYCAYATDRFLFTNGSLSGYGNQIDYSSGSTSAFGNSPNSGGWRGAGTNGGTNMLVLDISNGFEPGFVWQNMRFAFGGAHLIASVMPTGGDTANVPDRGQFFAQAWQNNNVGYIANGYTQTINSMPSEGLPCGTNGVISGGYGGINGCGCNVVMSVGATLQEAQNHRNESWHQITDDSLDGQGNGWFYYTWTCNYNNSADPWYL